MEAEFLRQIGRKYGTDKFGSVHTYQEFYARHLKHLRERPFVLLEVGVQNGYSLRVWEEYFPKASIYGIDKDPQTEGRGSDRSTVFIGSQDDETFLDRVLSKTGAPDVVIDDGSHVVHHQKKTFSVVFPRMSSEGIYIIEDLRTSYDRRFRTPWDQSSTAAMLADAIHTDGGPGGKLKELHVYRHILFAVHM